MKKSYTLFDLIELLRTTNLPVFYEERIEVTKDHILLEVISGKNFYADSQTHLQLTNLQITFYTKDRLNLMYLQDFISENFNTSFTVKYLDDNNWYNIIYEIEIFISDWDANA